MLSSIRTGIVLLILVGVASAAGTLALQRPQTEPEQLLAAYSVETLRWLDRIGLTDVFHSWWFAALLALLGLNMVFRFGQMEKALHMMKTKEDGIIKPLILF